MVYGLAKILWTQDHNGLPLRACFIAGPDSTITRNANRWASGFGYGGKLIHEWPTPTVVLDAKPNACGMLVGGLEHRPEAHEVASRLESMLASTQELDGITLDWDFTAGNHFIDLFALHFFPGGLELPPYGFIIHASCPELRDTTALGPGLYWDKSPTLMALAEVVETPWGPLRLLTGDAAVEYVDFVRRAIDFAAAKRLRVAEALFGDFRPLANVYHQGLLSASEMLLGCHSTLWNDPLPLTLRPDLPSYLLHGLPNLADGVISRLPRAGEVPEFVLHALRSANIIPHGGGYALEGIRGVRRAWSSGNLRFFELDREASEASDLVSNPTSLPVRYRGRQVLMLTLEWGLAEVVARLDPLLVIKA